MAFGQWVKSCFENIIDPDKDAEVAELTKLLQSGINERKRSFVLGNVLGSRPYKQAHLDQARNGIYQRYLARAWADGRVQESELEILAWVSKCLEIPAQTLRAINLETARPKFAQALAKAMDDGNISPSEAAVLTEIAKAGGLTLPQFVKEFFLSEGEQFLRGIFAAAVADNQSAVDVLEQLVASAARLGLSCEFVVEAIRPQAVRYIEHVLADAKEDDVLTTEEEATLRQLLKTFALPTDVQRYVSEEIQELRLLTEINNGKLPSRTAPPGISLKAGELVHYYGRAVWQFLRLLKNGPDISEHVGVLAITDSRLIFSSATRSDSFGFGSIVAHDSSHSVIEVQRQAKPVQRFVCQYQSRIPAAIFESALRMANQTMTNQDVKRRSRHIPRDVRQRVWQRYSGRCAECNAADYLEFDHIVPVAKGGSNSDANVQLLCRKCNLKKSDLI